MAKFVKTWRGVEKKKIHPTTFKPGDECPPELEYAAGKAGALDVAEKAPAKAVAK